MNISKILVDGVEVDVLSQEDLLDKKKVISFINADAEQTEAKDEQSND